METFRDRIDAGRRLGRLLKQRGLDGAVVLGIPRGGVRVAAEVAAILHSDLGVIVARKLGAPGQPELAIGAVTADGCTYINQALVRELQVSVEYLGAERARQVAEAQRREEAFDGRRRPLLEGRTVVVVDDGLATGATAIAALRSIRRSGAGATILAVPVAPSHTIRELASEAGEIIALLAEDHILAIGQCYEDFEPVEADEVIRLLDQFQATQGHPRTTPLPDPGNSNSPGNQRPGLSTQDWRH